MPIKITCPQCSHVHRFSRPYPMPGSEVQCGCGRVLVISFPADLMTQLEGTGAAFTDPHAPAAPLDGRPYQPAPTPALPRHRHPVKASGDDSSGPPGDPS